ncbi:MAG TPA: hypothetical protein VFN23_03915, partial [Ktedonobacteraceae bacterium]|nr:hypothetical protein [Ktedonobacteraceae bacterium]
IAPQAIDNDSSGQLLKITVDASHNLWALGLDPNGNTLLLSLNKGIWTSFPVPNLFTASNTATIYNQYQDLSITNSQDIWLAGEKVRTSNPSGDTTYTPLVEHWDGHHWQAVSEHYHDSASLLAISVSSGIVWSIGFTYYPGQPFQPFVATTCK